MLYSQVIRKYQNYPSHSHLILNRGRITSTAHSGISPILSLILPLILPLTLGLLTSGCNKPKQSPFESPVVTINNESLNAINFSKKLVQRYLEQDIRDPKDEILNILKQQIVEDFVIQKLFSDYAKSKNILVKKNTLDAEVQKLISSYPSPESFEAFMKQSGQNIESIRSYVRNQTLRRLARENLLKDQTFNVSHKEIKSYYYKNSSEFIRGKQIHIKQIMVENEEDAFKITELLKKERYKNFESLAKKHSLSPEKKNGGDLGWMDIEAFSAFKEASKTPRGQVTPTIKSENGYHIFKIMGSRKARKMRFSKVKKQIESRILERKKIKFMAQWLQKQVQASDVKIDNDLLSKIVVKRPGYL